MSEKSPDCKEFQKFCEDHSDDEVVDMLERICDSSCGVPNYGVTITDTHRHDAINYTICGSVEFKGETFHFIVDNGNQSGTVVRDWGTVDEIGVFTPPTPARFTFVPIAKNLSPAKMSVYELWTKEAWFQDKLRSYHYDRHFAPGVKTESHYRDWAKSKGLEIVPVRDDRDD